MTSETATTPTSDRTEEQPFGSDWTDKVMVGAGLAFFACLLLGLLLSPDPVAMLNRDLWGWAALGMGIAAIPIALIGMALWILRRKQK